MYLVLLETSGNQNFIFSTNKLRENIGASELTYRAGTQWVMDAVATINQWQQPKVYLDSSSIRAALLDREFNQPISADVEIEIIIATSGKALLLAKNKELAKQIIQAVTHKALIADPGLENCLNPRWLAGEDRNPTSRRSRVSCCNGQNNHEVPRVFHSISFA
jgi:hypothetical protein